jgi:hypothetical protein
MPKVIPFPKKPRPRKKQSVTFEDYKDTLKCIEQLVEETNPKQLEEVHGILEELEFGAYFSAQLRDETIEQLQELIDSLYVKAMGH